MAQPKLDYPGDRVRFSWRHAVLLGIVFGPLGALLTQAPIAQSLAYHSFADVRTLLGVANGLNVLSSLPFLIVGILGLRYCLRTPSGPAHPPWWGLFAGVALVGLTSAYYHLNPSNATLVWDRLSMTIGFMALFIALTSEYLASRLIPKLLGPALLLGAATVAYWHWRDDLRLYIWVQLLPLLTIPVLMMLFSSGYSHQGVLVLAWGCYLVAKVAELYDEAIFSSTQGVVSGHTLKHLFAAMGCYLILRMLQTRRRLSRRDRLRPQKTPL
ncbi:ceramidase domain-containing protein [Ferrimonas sp. SCSIO 43195]|uniref:ceramidase domain-containing protein n=1 Tax=Ferrimonas sp. SCSIO 43195 TaxID=2822844 RepID=UPI002075D09C|nr:ceramidase domain-containing protein [Ferrimonas sp. SCSIO 43195]USD35737.1 ceramidase domain-containing protein [Ferrimonas sp. SCSIO 43195]